MQMIETPQKNKHSSKVTDRNVKTQHTYQMLFIPVLDRSSGLLLCVNMFCLS